MENPQLVMPYIKRRLFGKLLPPREIVMGVNDVCNAKCTMCDLPFKNQPQEFDINIFRKLIEEVKPFKPSISFKLTESSLKRDIHDFIKTCTDAGLQTSMTTNGYMLPVISERLVKAGLSTIQVSIGGLGEKHDETRRLPGAFKRAMEGIEKLFFYKKQYNSNIRVIIDFAICPENCGDLYDTYCYFKKYSVDLFKFPHMNFTSPVFPVKIDVDLLWEQINKVKADGTIKYKFLPELSKEEIREYYYDNKFMKGFTNCFIPYTHCYIDFNYDVRGNAKCVDLVLGNIKDKPFMEIWNGEKYRNFRQALKKQPFDYCKRCCGVTTAPRHL